MDLALTQGDPIVVAGSWEDVGPYSVLMAQQIRTEASASPSTDKSEPPRVRGPSRDAFNSFATFA